jgi:3-methylcrotonyl-CoA carboxylase alpha subunit
MFQNLLIANRGEIAVRIIRTVRRLGLTSIAVFSDADASAAHVEAADRAIRIGPPEPRDSYLNIAAIIDAARQSGAEAVHPGYGFLAENADFAAACAAAGLIFVGPPVDAIRAMGLKDRAKALLKEAGVPIVPGYLGADQKPDTLKAEATRIGYPVLIKAVAGGGGKGMRRVDEASEFLIALEGAKREALSAFGDDRVLLEKYIARARHIEIQVFGDTQGNVVHLFERDCSLQRRHQKVIEEAPAPSMQPKMRQAMASAAIRAARAVGYVGAGTVEFIADASKGLKEDGFWFMEMNTRLQVEHPVTEAIAGVDLVEWQLKVAAGEPLPAQQDALRINGHAIEARLYAEDPSNDFLPSVGTIARLNLPTNVRVDSGFRAGDTVSPFYDPMLAKVIAHGTAREDAVERLLRALGEIQVAGPRTNNAFLIRILNDEEFRQGTIDTGLLERKRDTLAPAAVEPPPHVLEAAARLVVQEHLGHARRSDPWDQVDGYRHIGPAPWLVDFLLEGKRRSVQLPPIDKPDGAPTAYRLAGGAIAVFDRGETFLLSEYDPLAVAEAAGDIGNHVSAPMSGKVTRILVKSGDHVRKGQPLAVLEAMKMEHTLTAPSNVDIESVDVNVGEHVQEGTVIVRFKPVEAP